VLDFVLRDDATVKAFASASQLDPTNIAAAHQALTDSHWERDVPWTSACASAAGPTCFCRIALAISTLRRDDAAAAAPPRWSVTQVTSSLTLPISMRRVLWATVEKRDKSDIRRSRP